MDRYYFLEFSQVYEHVAAGRPDVPGEQSRLVRRLLAVRLVEGADRRYFARTL